MTEDLTGFMIHCHFMIVRQLFTGSVADMSRPPTTLCSSSTLADELALGPVVVAGLIVIPFHLFVFFTSSSSESLRGGGSNNKDEM